MIRLKKCKIPGDIGHGVWDNQGRWSTTCPKFLLIHVPLGQACSNSWRYSSWKACQNYYSMVSLKWQEQQSHITKDHKYEILQETKKLLTIKHIHVWNGSSMSWTILVDMNVKQLDKQLTRLWFFETLQEKSLNYSQQKLDIFGLPPWVDEPG